jgi:hypothetical protein
MVLIAMTNAATSRNHFILLSKMQNVCTCIPTVLQPHGDMNERAVALAFFRHIKRDKSAKRIFAFLGLNFCFMLVHDT